MSDTVRSIGYIAILAAPLTDVDALEAIQESLYDIRSIIGVNDEGTLVYSDVNRAKKLSERTELYGLHLGRDSTIGTRNDFATLVRTLGLTVVENSIEPYSCIWYNGTDSDMATLTIEEFRARVQA
jgi:hypothetical protein